VRAVWKVVPWMEQQGGGAILHVTSIAGLEAGWGTPYAAAKAALITHAKTIAATLATKGIRVNTVAPGSIEFPGGGWEKTRLTNPERYAKVLVNVPSGRFGTPEEVAAAAVFLCSARASWISGQTLVVDGVQHKGIF
jgi:3-oxoacyl-[acyl-carrier protein] reductase